MSEFSSGIRHAVADLINIGCDVKMQYPRIILKVRGGWNLGFGGKEMRPLRDEMMLSWYCDGELALVVKGKEYES